MDPNFHNTGPSGSAPRKPETWRSCKEANKVIEMFYSEGNFYHDIYMEELANLAETSHKNVRDTLSRLRKKDERAGKYVPPPPKQMYEFTSEQRGALDQAFLVTPQMDSDGARELSEITGLTVKQINNWFCNQRRKADGRSAEKDKKRRERIREDMKKNGLGRVGTFRSEAVELFEKEYETMLQLEAIGGGKVRIPYTELVEKTGMERKKIRDWFSKRKGRDKRFLENMENTREVSPQNTQQNIQDILIKIVTQSGTLCSTDC
ncbi:Homeobox domain-containing protein [Caenorhabditis elegans]|uniref:Homeobox domain-containing protein n=1 Tax=Caenorhabditis elegans TaxID=6239 RepID=Q9XUG3_CAEEL|nr:Homeobox domain-containing protein [Caenorhabditis elegans]CAB05155.2 Homeobox domain-containing protein [Caenorhabditis elegans]|eukprot:NP_503081.2 C. Elegans Homeobox [Caenorhabditis elegans]